MDIIKEKLEIEESLKKRITNLLKFQNIKGKLVNGNVISIPKTNLAYIELHKLVIDNILHNRNYSIKKIPNFFIVIIY